MTKRPGGAAVTGGALLALLYPGAGSAAAQDTDAFPRTVSGGYVSWTTTGSEPAGHGLAFDVTEPAVQSSTDLAWFPATGGGADPETGAADVELAGAARLVPSTGSVQPLTLGGLRLRLDGDGGALHARTAVGGQARDVALADVAASGAGPVVRSSGVTWTGLRASLTDEGARLLSEWSGSTFAKGDGLGLLEVTVGTGGTTPAPTTEPPAETPLPSPGASAPEKQRPTDGKRAEPSAAVTRAALTAGGEQEVTGAGFEPGEVVLVTIDEDTRYQAVADEEGRISRAFPVYVTAVEGAHTVELHTVTGEHAAVAQFEVRSASD
ncbi:HtaA domain-containing protein [Streptomyces sp. NPDC093591]|uniref:HtaA domain-containing protein n=1 Tax=Streptomyces sp. NPDC093591 TaxID=3366044 RepID=UPI0038159EB6